MKRKKKVGTTAWDPVDSLKTERDKAGYLEAALEDGDAALVAARWITDGAPSPAPLDTNTVNDALLPLLRAVPPREAAHLALDVDGGDDEVQVGARHAARAAECSR